MGQDFPMPPNNEEFLVDFANREVHHIPFINRRCQLNADRSMSYSYFNSLAAARKPNDRAENTPCIFCFTMMSNEPVTRLHGFKEGRQF
jgi:hypothetical protein